MRTIVRNHSMRHGDTLKLALTLHNMPTPAEAVEVSIKELCSGTEAVRLNLDNGGVIAMKDQNVFVIFLDKKRADLLIEQGYTYSIVITYGAECGTAVEGQITIGDR